MIESRSGRSLWLLGLFLGVTTVARADSAAAEALFERGKALMGEGRFAEACPKFEESYRLDPGGGVLMNVATCHEKMGRTATAWAEYKEALGLATKAGRADREKFARERIEALEKELPRLLIEVPPPVRVAGLEIRRGAEVLGAGSWGEPLPVDPGPHRISVLAPGFRERVYEVVARASEKTTLRVDPLERLPDAPPASASASSPPPPASTSAPLSPPPSTPPPSSSRRTAGYVVGGVGLLSLGIGGFFGFRAISKRQDSDADCPGGACNARGWSTYEDAKSAARISNVGLALGVVGAGVGTWLVLSSRNETAVSVGPSGFALRSAW